MLLAHNEDYVLLRSLSKPYQAILSQLVMTALPVNLLQILRLSIDLVHRPRQAVLVLLVLRVLCVRIIARAYQAVLMGVLLARYNRVLLIDVVAVGLLPLLWVPGLLAILMLHCVGTGVLNEIRACDHVLHALLLYLLEVALVLQHPTQVLYLADVADSGLLELEVLLVQQVLVDLRLGVVAGVLLRIGLV